MQRRAVGDATDDWWEADSFAAGGGLGLVLHRKRGNRWRVADVLRKSPAERAGVRRGDYLLTVDEYELSAPDSDGIELLGLVRASRGGSHRLSLQRAGAVVEAELTSRPMRSLVRAATRAGQDLRGGGGGGGGGCSRCRSCAPTVIGWLDCGTGRRCEQRCLIA